MKLIENYLAKHTEYLVDRTYINIEITIFVCRFLSYSAFKRNSENNPPALIYRSPYQSTNVFGLSTMKSRCRIHSVVRFYFLAKRWKIHLKNIQERKVHQKYCAAREKNQYIISFLGLRASFVYTSCENQIEQKITSFCCCCVFFFVLLFSQFSRSQFSTQKFIKNCSGNYFTKYS